jgi:hypothetical protein
MTSRVINVSDNQPKTPLKEPNDASLASLMQSTASVAGIASVGGMEHEDLDRLYTVKF